MSNGRPNRGSGSVGSKNPEGGGNKDQYSLEGRTTSTKTTKNKTSKK